MDTFDLKDIKQSWKEVKKIWGCKGETIITCIKMNHIWESIQKTFTFYKR